MLVSQASQCSCRATEVRASQRASAAVKDIYNAEDIDKAQVAIKAFAVDYGAKYPKAVAKIVDDADVFTEPNNRSIPVSWVHRKRGDAEVGGSDASARPATSFDLDEFVLSAGEANLQSFDFAKPALALRFGDAGFEVVSDLNEPGSLSESGHSSAQRTQAFHGYMG